MSLLRCVPFKMAPLFFAAAAFATAASSAETIRVEHAQGIAAVEKNPQPVLVFDLAALDTLDALGVPVAGVPSGVKPDYLSRYNSADYPQIGSLFAPDFEAVAAIDPGLIVIGGRSAGQHDELSRIATTIDVTADYTDFLNSAEQRNEMLAAIFDKQVEVSEKIATLDQSIVDLKNKAKDAGSALVVLTTGGKISAYGPGSRFGIVHTEFGLAAAAADLDVATHGQAISFEFILETDPDYLLVIDRDAAIGEKGQSAQALFDNDLINQTRAARNGQVVYLQSDTWYLGGTGLSAMQRMVDELSAALE